MEQLAAWMPLNMPPANQAAFLHNDYKYDNMLLNPDDLGDIRAVLDWEMATVGDPLMDLGTALVYWIQASDSPALRMFSLTHLPGNLDRQQALDRYATQSGRDVSHILFYYVFSCFKLGVILQQIYARYKKGLTQDSRFAGLIQVVKACGESGRSALEAGKIA
jgi:aminoglycoside phosphotransferase (APT) family kinase protein